MNNLSATGNIGSDAEVRHTADGTVITSWSVAVSSGYGKNEKTNWVRCSLFGKRGETLAQYLKKGTQVGVNGEISLNEYEAKDGSIKTTLELNVSNVTLLGKKDAAEKSTTKEAPPAAEEFEEDIPF
jgi:single-strand DNA-binding protein